VILRTFIVRNHTITEAVIQGSHFLIKRLKASHGSQSFGGFGQTRIYTKEQVTSLVGRGRQRVTYSSAS
jgi:hypothetical protein